jgi:hypothetical protein
MRLTKQEIGALILAALPFVVHYRDRSVDNSSGETRVLYDYDYAGVIFGIIALFVVVLALVATRDQFRGDYAIREDLRGESASFHYAVLAAIATLAVYQVLKGASLI